MKKKSDETPPEEEGKLRCFIVTPIGDTGSDIRRHTDGLIEAVIEPVLGEKYWLDVSHTMTTPGSITRAIIKSLYDADLVIVNLTGLNPNVMYELAVRHAFRKPVVCLIEKGTPLPFDISAERTIMFINDMAGTEKLKKDLAAAAEAAMKEEFPSNPIYDVIKEFSIRKDSEPGDINSLILERLDRIESQRIQPQAEAIQYTEESFEMGRSRVFRTEDISSNVLDSIIDKFHPFVLFSIINSRDIKACRVVYCKPHLSKYKQALSDLVSAGAKSALGKTITNIP